MSLKSLEAVGREFDESYIGSEVSSAIDARHQEFCAGDCDCNELYSKLKSHLDTQLKDLAAGIVEMMPELGDGFSAHYKAGYEVFRACLKKKLTKAGYLPSK